MGSPLVFSVSTPVPLHFLQKTIPISFNPCTICCNLLLRYTQDQPKEVRISLYSHQPFTSFEAKPTCSWVHVDSINSLAPYTSEMVLLISPLSKKGNFSCSILVNSTITLPIAVTMGGVSSQPIIHWIEGEQGNIYTSNGDSAYTNYRTFYRLLQTQYRVHIHQRSTDTFDVCICFDECKMGCRYPFYIVGIEKTRSVMMQQWMRERYQFITLRHGKACSAKIQGKSFRNVFFILIDKYRFMIMLRLLKCLNIIPLWKRLKTIINKLWDL